MAGRSSSKQESYIRTLVKHLTKDPLIQNNDPPKQEKQKQTRRRLHTTRPYQERLLNMAEARREIVTALKFHRASMKQQAAATITATSTAATTATPQPMSYYDNLNLILPKQTLGLNLNIKNFNLDPISVSTSGTSAASNVVVSGESGGSLHYVVDDEGMEEIRSLGEKHQMEWNDTMNLVKSVQWCEFLKTMEIEKEKNLGYEDDDDDYGGINVNPFDQVMEFPSWLINGNESEYLQQRFDDCFSDGCLQDPALPCMDIGEIEGMDGEWLA